MNAHQTQPIGVFDSGCGGLTVLRVLRARFPQEQFVYFADTAHLPYGDKSPEEIRNYTIGALQWLQDVAQVKLVVVACHTSSAVALEHIQNKFDVPLIGTIYPLINTLIGNPHYRNIGIIATAASAASRMHEKILYAHGFTGTIHSIGCPDLVPLIEAPVHNREALTTSVQKYLKLFHTESLDTLIYGCTHYPLIASLIKAMLPPTMQYVDPAYAIADAVASQCDTNQHDEKNGLQKLRFYCTGDPLVFARKIAAFLPLPHAQISVKKTELL